MCVSAFVRVSVCVRVCVCVFACVRMCARVCVYVHVCVKGFGDCSRGEGGSEECSHHPLITVISMTLSSFFTGNLYMCYWGDGGNRLRALGRGSVQDHLAASCELSQAVFKSPGRVLSCGGVSEITAC